MEDEVEELVLKVRADLAPFRRDMDEMKQSVDGSLTDGLARAGDSLERSLRRALRSGTLGFDDLKKAALRAMDEIAAASLRALLPSGGSGGGLTGTIGGLLGAALGLPGRAHGGPVSEARPYLVGERGPEIFVPGSSGAIQPLSPAISSGSHVVNVRLSAPPEAHDVAVLARSQRQIGHAVARAMRGQGR